ncbi:hypothetical protein LZ31DRAFT_281287 [Colletotrichum somersetense]|nr:hypothetical protein LZ31DRAFT_281287 [Colletotrichum somersetense]
MQCSTGSRDCHSWQAGPSGSRTASSTTRIHVISVYPLVIAKTTLPSWSAVVGQYLSSWAPSVEVVTTNPRHRESRCCFHFYLRQPSKTPTPSNVWSVCRDSPTICSSYGSHSTMRQASLGLIHKRQTIVATRPLTRSVQHQLNWLCGPL